MCRRPEFPRQKKNGSGCRGGGNGAILVREAHLPTHNFFRTHNFSQINANNVSPINRNNQGFAKLGRLITFATFNASTLLPQLVGNFFRRLTVCNKQKIKPSNSPPKHKEAGTRSRPIAIRWGGGEFIGPRKQNRVRR